MNYERSHFSSFRCSRSHSKCARGYVSRQVQRSVDPVRATRQKGRTPTYPRTDEPTGRPYYAEADDDRDGKAPPKAERTVTDNRSSRYPAEAKDELSQDATAPTTPDETPPATSCRYARQKGRHPFRKVRQTADPVDTRITGANFVSPKTQTREHKRSDTGMADVTPRTDVSQKAAVDSSFPQTPPSLTFNPTSTTTRQSLKRLKFSLLRFRLKRTALNSPPKIPRAAQTYPTKKQTLSLTGRDIPAVTPEHPPTRTNSARTDPIAPVTAI